MAEIPHVVPRTGIVRASHQNLLIDQVNQNTEDIASLEAGGVPADEVQDMIDASLTTHIEAPTPHKAYDIDMPSLTIIFETGLI